MDLARGGRGEGRARAARVVQGVLPTKHYDYDQAAAWAADFLPRLDVVIGGAVVDARIERELTWASPRCNALTGILFVSTCGQRVFTRDSEGK